MWCCMSCENTCGHIPELNPTLACTGNPAIAKLHDSPYSTISPHGQHVSTCTLVIRSVPSTQIATPPSPSQVLPSTQRTIHMECVARTKKPVHYVLGKSIIESHSASRQLSITHNTVHFLAALHTADSEDFMACLPHTVAAMSTTHSVKKFQLCTLLVTTRTNVTHHFGCR